MMSRADEIRTNIGALEQRIATACARAARPRHEVRLIAVSKTFSASDVVDAIAAGISDVGENKVQEARGKKPEVAAAARWHLIGHLQSNKAKDAVRLFDVIQTIDSVALGEKVGRAAEALGKTQEVLLQVNIGREAQKSGVPPEEVQAMMKAVSALGSMRVSGLMAIPPAGEPGQMRPFFRELRAMRDDLGMTELSIGMTDDFEVAIEEGATMIRVGRAIFGSRG